MKTILSLAAVSTVALLAVQPAAGSKKSLPRKATVTISDFEFKPKTVRVAVGASVRFVNRDRAEHTATAAGRFDTGIIEHGKARTVRVKKAGTVRYICDLHPFMRAVIVAR